MTLHASDDERHDIEQEQSADLGLRRGERLVLAVGIHVACALIATTELSTRRARARRKDRFVLNRA